MSISGSSEPRSNTTVTNRFQAELTDAFAGADTVWLGPVHRAEAIPADQRLDRAALVKDLKSRGVDAAGADSAAEIVDGVLGAKAENGEEVVLILSNGAFGGIYNRFREAAGQNSV